MGGTWIKFENITLSEIYQSQMIKYHVITLRRFLAKSTPLRQKAECWLIATKAGRNKRQHFIKDNNSIKRGAQL